jgi:pimeloyl-ACP methyl ester carboxylesterase
MYDLRGHGMSSVPQSGYSTDAMAADLAALLDHLGIESAHVVGHSFGGAVALQLALRDASPAASITIADAPVPGVVPPVRARDSPSWSIWKRHLKDLGIYVHDEDPLDYRIISRLLSGRGSGGRREPWLLGQRQRQRWERLLRDTSAAREFGETAGLTAAAVRTIGRPTQLLYGELSFCLPTGRKLAKLLPDAKLVVLPGVGHFFPITGPALLTDRVRKFLGAPQSSK